MTQLQELKELARDLVTMTAFLHMNESGARDIRLTQAHALAESLYQLIHSMAEEEE